MIVVSGDVTGEPARREQHTFRQGFAAMMSFWPGAVPFGIAFALAAQDAGFHDSVILTMSFFIFSAPIQLAIVALKAGGAGLFAITLTVALIATQHVFLGITLVRRFPGEMTRRRALLAWLLTEATFGLTLRRAADRPGAARYFLGAGLSMYLVFTTSTALGVIAGTTLASVQEARLDFIVPLIYLSLLVPLLRQRVDFVVAGTAAIVLVVMTTTSSVGFGTLIALICAMLAGSVYENLAERVGWSN